MEPVLKAKKIRKVYGSKGNIFPALGSISMEVYPGEFVGVMGPSGAGKSTLLNVLSSIDKPTSGEIEIGGRLLSKMTEKEVALFRRNMLGFIFQDYNLLDMMTLKDNIVLPLVLNKVPVEEINQKFMTLAKQFGLYDLRNKYPTELSGGQRQRTAVCRSLITEPELIFADEPTGALDSKAATNLLDSLTAAKEERNATILMVTHDTFAASYCERILFIKDGEIFTEIYRGKMNRKQFFNKILEVLVMLGGDLDDPL
ncbi:ABC transporter ATP-binding protein [Listeria costaricensis]|uniref:ABC transporter ATP-binding protein n=1 Tax=Listeria costaricensis TaxID=2026604 RepID=UPI000C07311F|nr:ABC transporter ATP-binding protein [Listeria costaricensis]